MGMFRESGSTEIDIIKEMAEGLGSTGLKLEDVLEKANATRETVIRLVQLCHEGAQDMSEVNDSIRAIQSFGGSGGRHSEVAFDSTGGLWFQDPSGRPRALSDSFKDKAIEVMIRDQSVIGPGLCPRADAVVSPVSAGSV